MTKQEMLNKMCLIELAQADAKAIGRCRVFDVEVVESRALLQHVFLSEQGVRGALASLTEMEILGLHLLNHRREAVGLEFFKRVYPGSVPANLYASHTVRFKGLLQTIKANLIRRGILLFCTLTQGFEEKSVSERLRFCFPEEFGSFLPAPFPSHRLAAAASRQYRKEVLQDKLAEILRPERAPGKEPATQDEARWLLANGELRFGGKPFSVERIKAWPLTQLTGSLPGAPKVRTTSSGPSHCSSTPCRVWGRRMAAPDDLLPLWKLGLPGAKCRSREVFAKQASNADCWKRPNRTGRLFPLARTG